jgi:hypothetical protein
MQREHAVKQGSKAEHWPTPGYFFDVFKIAGDGEPVLIQGAQSLKAAVTRVTSLRESFPGDYLIVSQATGKRTLFTSRGEIRRS